MRFLDSLAVAFTALITHSIRSLLTTLGIIIGVASVIMLVAVAEGARSEVERHIAALGTQMLMISPGAKRVRGRTTGEGSQLPLTEADVTALSSEVAGVQAVSGRLSGTVTAIRREANWITSTYGVHSGYLAIRDWPIAEGRGIMIDDVHSRARVVVLGETVRRELFGEEPAVGRFIRVAKFSKQQAEVLSAIGSGTGIPLKVVGVLSPKGQSSGGRDQDDVLFVPLRMARGQIVGSRSGQANRVGRIYLKVGEHRDLALAAEDVKDLLRERRSVRQGAKDNFLVRDLAAAMRARNESRQTLGWLLAATSVISLVVGGIGIMNIMLVSVMERTREIGLRMAVGATRRVILSQFLLESVLLAILGGLIGVVFGLAGTVLISFYAEWPVLIDPLIVVIALAAAGLTGVLFGYLPARRAAHLNPIDALRSE